ncbi:HAD family hydrolase [Streptomyces iconiensis]|uniref:HAD family hydrolase n=1 Tax=Streptomyces iconiensis TaxID=1384038 RepID=A0ABT6ZNZ3_9ACTN|nr:HAD family hydrolase [Streptomyces iconiensis]MDJ1130775.1 HAD family hydrolase [Streptomyces iconiensis]
MPALVVFDCFGTLVTSRPLPDPEQFTAGLADVLELDRRTAGAVVRTVYGAVFTAMSDPYALQPATMDLLDAALREQGAPRRVPAMERALWHALGCADPGQYALCEPVADAMRRVSDAGHTVGVLSNCYLPGGLMRALLRQSKVPETYDRALFTADGGPKKPDPRAFRLIGEGDFERRVMVGDSVELDLAPAAALGWDTVRVDPAAPAVAGLFTLLDM